MKEITNNTLGLLIAISMVVSLAGVWLMMNQPTVPITGFAANPSGNASVTVTSATSISFVSGYSGPVYSIPRPATGNTTNDTTDDNPRPFVIQNDGTDPVNITIDATSFNFTGGSAAQFCVQYNNTYCAPGGVRAPAQNSSMKRVYNGTYQWTTLANAYGYTHSATEPEIYYLNYTPTTSTAMIDINMSVSSDESTGTKQSTFTFTATATTT
ncbi:Uncharacterised protein [Candidatus Norongarragalina meridionalis]|nr:Uncharacterised protein [Candidatus Norongarragalina meridionalis]